MIEVFTSRFDGARVMFASDKAGRIMHCLTGLASAVAREPRLMRNADDDFWPDEDDWMSEYRPYEVRDGVLSVPVQGVLLNNFGYSVEGWATGYQYIRKAVERGMADDAVKGIAFVIDSPGGEVSGNFDLVDLIYSHRSDKEMRAYAADSAYSAAYSIASAADSITVSRSGGVGSIGVYTMHVDYSRALENAGVKPTFIFAGKYKVDGNPYEPLSDETKARIQAHVDEDYDVFVGTVSRNRGMDEAAVRATEALSFSASQAVSNGLADKVGPLDESIAAFAASLSTRGAEQMSDVKGNAADHQAAADKAFQDGRAEGMKAGAALERDRIAAIFASDAAKDRPKAAHQVAFKTSFSGTEATDFLAGLATEASALAPKQSVFRDAMKASGNPEIGADDGEDAEKPSRAKSALALIRPAARKE